MSFNYNTFVEETEAVQSSGSGSRAYGLNQGLARLVGALFLTNAGKDGSPGEAWEFTFAFAGAEKPTNYRIYPFSGQVTVKENGVDKVITDPKNPKFIAAFNQYQATFLHIFRPFMSTDTIKKALSSLPQNASFQQFGLALCQVMPANFREVDLDIFLQYQYSISQSQTRTFLEIPKSIKHGLFIAPSTVGKTYTPVTDKDGLRYVIYQEGVQDANGNPAITETHPFTRSSWFETSKFSYQQGESNDTSAANNPMGGGLPSGLGGMPMGNPMMAAMGSVPGGMPPTSVPAMGNPGNAAAAPYDATPNAQGFNPMATPTQNDGTPVAPTFSGFMGQ